MRRHLALPGLLATFLALTACGGEAGADTLPEAAAATAAFLLDAAVRCDEPLFVTAATESDTEILFGDGDWSFLTVGD